LEGQGRKREAAGESSFNAERTTPTSNHRFGRFDIALFFQGQLNDLLHVLEEFIDGPALRVTSPKLGHFAHVETVFVLLDHYKQTLGSWLHPNVVCCQAQTQNPHETIPAITEALRRANVKGSSMGRFFKGSVLGIGDGQARAASSWRLKGPSGS
jgi:hypothetical protein